MDVPEEMEKHQFRPLNILYLSQYFYPEVGATQNRAYDMAYFLARRGHRVTVLTEFPNHPSGVLPRRYKHRFWERQKLNGFRVIRTWVFATPRKTALRRLLFYFSFMKTAAWAGLLVPGRFDVVYATSPPLFVGAAGLFLSRVKNAPFVLEVRDLWPESAVELGELHNRRLIHWARWLEELFYRKARKIVVVTKGILNQLLERGVSAQKLVFIPNGSNTEIYSNRGQAFKKELGLEDKFVVGYAGIFGLAQGMNFLCDIAESLKTNPDIHFLFVGEGPKKPDVLHWKEEKNLTNLTVLAEVPRQEIAQVISAFDVSLVPLKKNRLFEGALPSKMFDSMACERPILLSVAGEAAEVLRRSGGGMFVEPENLPQMKEAILRLKQNPELRIQMGKKGRRFVEENFSRENLALKLEQVLVNLKIPFKN